MRTVAAPLLLCLLAGFRPASVVGYQVVSVSPMVFPSVAGVRDFYQSQLVVHLDQVPVPNIVQISAKDGTNVTLQVTGYGPLGNGYWAISTNHVVAPGTLPGICRIVADSTSVDATKTGLLGLML